MKAEKQAITTGEAAVIVGVSVQRIRQLVTDGRLVKRPDGKLDLGLFVRAFIQHRLDDARRFAPSVASTRHQELRAKSLQMDLWVKEGQLVDVDEAVDMTLETIGALKARIMSVPAQVGRDDPALRRLIEEQLNAAFDATVIFLGKGTKAEVEDEDDVEAPAAAE